MKWIILAAVLFGAVFADNLDFEQLSEGAKDIVNGNNKFGFDLYKILAQKDGNLIFSPISISSCLSLLYFMTGGNSAKEISETLQLSLNHTVAGFGIHEILQTFKRDSLSWANNGFIDNSVEVKASYAKSLKDYFETELEVVNFREHKEKARAHINEWVANKTGEKFTELLNSGAITETTRLVLVSTVNFQGIWHYMFKPEFTREEVFHVNDSSTKKVALMSGKGIFGFASNEELNATIVQIPYKDYELSMIIILPDQINGLVKLEEDIGNLDFYNDIILKLDNITVEVVIPKFKLEIGYELKDSLKKLGINDVFDSTKANFSNGFSIPGLEVSSVVHKTFIGVDEEGTLAGATSGAIVNERADVENLFPVFIADHPFLFAIIDDLTMSILFLGRYTTP